MKTTIHVHYKHALKLTEFWYLNMPYICYERLRDWEVYCVWYLAKPLIGRSAARNKPIGGYYILCAFVWPFVSVRLP